MWRRLGIVMLISTLLLPAAARAETPPHLGYGMMLAYPPAHLDAVSSAGFDWFKYFAYWDTVDPDRNRDYTWDTVDWRLDEACSHGLNLLLRVERDPDDWTPIQDGEMPAWEAFFSDLAAHVAQRRAACPVPVRVALEVWNEPNLDMQWEGEPVNPVRYTEMVRCAYRGAKAGDPHALVVAGGLAPTGGMPDGRAMDDVAFLEGMYAAGLKGHFDALSVHNYGYGGPPEDKTYGGGILNFRRAEDIYAVMVVHGDDDKPVWSTEFGWLLASPECQGTWEQSGFAWHQVTAAQQANYLQRAFAYADAHWPWMQVMIVSNLDFSVMTGWYGTCDPLRWFSVLEQDATPRPAYTALAQMPKRPRTWSTRGMALSPTTLRWMVPVSETRSVSQTVLVQNTGDLPFRWTAKATSPEFTLTVTPAEGDADTACTVTADLQGLPLGTYTAGVTITADSAEVPESPLKLPVQVYVVEHLSRAYLPLIRKR